MSSNCSAQLPRASRPTTSSDLLPQWPAVGSLSLGVFSLVTAEFLPASLLTAMSSDLDVSDGAAGQTVTATALVAAIAAPLIPLATQRLDRRWVLLTLTALLLVSNVLAVFASSLPMLLAARVVLGVSLGGFWAMAGALAMRLVPGHMFARAMSLVLTGVSVATVCAAPVGAWMGGHWGWRSAFVAASILSALTLAIQLATLPPLPPRDRPNLQALTGLLRRSAVRIALLAVLLVISGHFAGFTYIRPLIETVTRADVQTVSAMLLGYGLGGFFGNFVGGWIAERSERWSIVAGATLIALLALVLLGAADSVVWTSMALTLWGFAFGAFPVGFQTWIVRAAPDQAEGAGGLLVASFQMAIATGAIGGGLVVDRVGALGAPGFMAIAMLLGGLLTWRCGPRLHAVTNRTDA